MDRQLYLLVYDISDDKRRLKIARQFEANAERVQRSVFEGYFNKKELDRLLKRATQIMIEEEDSLRVYRLCARCRLEVITTGQADITDPPGLIIV
jgi:CRISPR-associated protein Cas2